MSQLSDRQLWTAFTKVERAGVATERQIQRKLRSAAAGTVSRRLRELEERDLAEQLHPNGDGSMLWRLYEPLDRVSNRPFRERYLALRAEQIAFKHEVAEAMGLLCGGRGDARALERKLGLLDHISGGGRKQRRTYRQTMVSYEEAERFCRVLHIDPVDVGV